MAQRRPDRLRWGIQKRSAGESWGGPLGFGWIDQYSMLPKGVHYWPASYETRREARDKAKRMTKKFAYLGPYHGWRFRAVRLRITVEVE